MHVVDCTKELIEDELHHFLVEGNLLRVDESLQGVVHILHAKIDLIVFVDLLFLYFHHVFEAHYVFVF